MKASMLSHQLDTVSKHHDSIDDISDYLILPVQAQERRLLAAAGMGINAISSDIAPAQTPLTAPERSRSYPNSASEYAVTACAWDAEEDSCERETKRMCPGRGGS